MDASKTVYEWLIDSLWLLKIADKTQGNLHVFLSMK